MLIKRRINNRGGEQAYRVPGISSNSRKKSPNSISVHSPRRRVSAFASSFQLSSPAKPLHACFSPTAALENNIRHGRSEKRVAISQSLIAGDRIRYFTVNRAETFEICSRRRAQTRFSPRVCGVKNLSTFRARRAVSKGDEETRP